MDDKVNQCCQELRSHQLQKLERFLNADDEQTFVALQLVRQSPPLDCAVECINSREIMSSIVCRQPCGEENLYETIPNEWLQPMSDNQRIAIVGQTQIGKTQILKRLLRDILIKNRYDYIFYVSLKCIDCSKPMNILQFLTDQDCFNWVNYQTQEDSKLFKAVVEKVNCTKDPKLEKVCIIIDDFQRSNFSFDNYSIDKSPFDKMKAGYLVSNILRKWFRNGQKVLLLDPLLFHQMNCHDAFRPMNVAYVLGIDHDGQRCLVPNDNLGCNKTDCELGEVCLGHKTTNHATEECAVCRCCHLSNCHYEIQSLCYSPCNCKMLIEHCSALPPSSTVTIAANVLVQKLTDTFHQYSDHPKSCCRFEPISCFAWKKYAKKVFVFEEDDLITSGLNDKEIYLFFSSKTENTFFSTGVVGDLVFYFSHLFLQELLAALWLLSCSNETLKAELNNFKKSFLNGNFTVLCDFMSEICEHCSLQKCRKSHFWIVKQDNLNVVQEFMRN